MKNTVTESLISTLNKKLKSKLSTSEIDYLRTYYHRLSGQDFTTERTAEFRDIALKHKKIGKTRKNGETIVEVQNISVEGQQQAQTIIYVIVDDRPFLINSLRLCLNTLNKTPKRTLHPIFEVTRAKNNIATKYQKFSPDLEKNNKETRTESYIHFLIDYTPEAGHAEIVNALSKVINDISTVVSDWPDMRQQVIAHGKVLESIKKRPVFSEYSEFFKWITEDHFAFLGYCELEISKSTNSPKVKINQKSLLGILRTAQKDKINLLEEILPPIVFTKNAPIVFTKTRRLSNIHRASYMDCIMFNHGSSKDNSNNKGSTQKVSCFLGFLAGSTSVLPTSEIPHIRKKADYVLETSSLRKGGYAYKELRAVLETLPRDKLFHMEIKQLYALCMTLLNQERRKTRLYLHKNVCGHFYSCLVYVPKDLFDTRLRKNIQNHLIEQLNARETQFDVYFSDSILTRIHFIIHTDPSHELSVDSLKLEADVQKIALDWNEKLFEKAKQQLNQDTASQYIETFRDGFSYAYQQDFSIDQAITDIQILEHISQTSIQATLSPSSRNRVQNNQADAGSMESMRASFKLYSQQNYIALSDILPILENMGVRIHTGRPYRIDKTDGTQFRIMDFEISRLDGKDFNFDDNSTHFESTFLHCWTNNIEDDGFNQLTLLAGLSWRQINMIRAYYKYLKQIRLRYSENYIIDAMINNPNLAIAISKLFEAKFDPKSDATNPKKLNTSIKKLLNKVSTLDEERIIQALLDVISSTRRTNYFQCQENGDPKSYISFKLNSRSIPRIPEPAPEFEIFVYSPRVEGVHLRGGKVARGGLRWSERPEDFRTEVLGLVKAQRVKNAVIVPVGSKGGFVAKQLPKSGQEDILQEVISCYKIFISSLLDVTDNLSGKKIIPPENVVRLDQDDPYLVVAADKGTATFSDIANEISENYGFWLGDAFASGGSAGYDHKKMGITARGAWESVKRHFRELGKDIQTTPFTVVGIGDMAGDVFGNGMLLSEHIKLVAAFNHKHIFIDPDPDPRSSFAERQRLFDTPRTSWEDYNQKLISKGGGIFSRNEKSIKLSPEAKKALSAKADAYAPDDLINVILKSEVELLWNGGIGTYVKSSSEDHADAQDRNNDGLRVDGAELRCKVIGEGGNLGMTQFGRIEFSRKGGLCYTDAIDNSAGVDTSDHEVNIKILLNGEIQKSNLTLKKRNALLAKMENTVADLVLANNYLQTQILSLETALSSELMPRQVRTIQILEDKGLLNRSIEFLPDDHVLKERQDEKDYLTRPELAVLLSYSKMDLYQGLLESSLPDDRYLSSEIDQYFPTNLNKPYQKQIQQHRLKREIISTQITNDLIGTMGATFHTRLIDLTGASIDDITACYIAARDITNHKSLVTQIQALDNKIDSAVQMQCFRDTSEALESTIFWLLRNIPTAMDIKSVVSQFKNEFKSLLEKTEVIMGGNDQRYHKNLDHLTTHNIPKKLAHEISARMVLVYGLDIINISLQLKKPVSFVGEIYSGMENALDLTWLQNQISSLKVDNIWHERSKFSLSTDLRNYQSQITTSISKNDTKNKSSNALAKWQKINSDPIAKLTRMTDSLKKESSIDISMISVLVSELSQFK